MSYPRYKVGDKLRVLVKLPWGAHFYEGDIIILTRFRRDMPNGGLEFLAREINSEDEWFVGNERHGEYLVFSDDPNDIDTWTDPRCLV